METLLSTQRRGDDDARFKKSFCPVCQYPFKSLKVNTPSKHISKCKRRKISPKKDCPDGISCISVMESHYQLYSHGTLAEYRKSLDGLAASQSSSTTSVESGNRRSNLQPFVKIDPITRDQIGFPEAFVDLTDSQTSSEEFKSTQSSSKSGTKSTFNIFKRSSQSTTPRSSNSSTASRSILGKRKSQISTNSAATRSKRTNGSTQILASQKRSAPSQKSTTKSKKRTPIKKVVVKIEKPISENPWTITASQVKKLRSPLKKIQIKNGFRPLDDDIIDLTQDEDDDVQAQTTVDPPSTSRYKSPRRNTVTKATPPSSLNENIPIVKIKPRVRRTLLTTSDDESPHNHKSDDLPQTVPKYQNSKLKKFPVVRIEKLDSSVTQRCQFNLSSSHQQRAAKPSKLTSASTSGLNPERETPLESTQVPSCKDKETNTKPEGMIPVTPSEAPVHLTKPKDDASFGGVKLGDGTPFLQSTQATSHSTLPSTMETQDSEDWSIPLPRGPGFAPLSPIKLDMDSLLSPGMEIESDVEDYFESMFESESDKMDKNDNLVENVSKTTKKLSQSFLDQPFVQISEKEQAKNGTSTSKITANDTQTNENHCQASTSQFKDQNANLCAESDCDSMDYTLLMGLTEAQTLLLGPKTPTRIYTKTPQHTSIHPKGETNDKLLHAKNSPKPTPVRIEKLQKLSPRKLQTANPSDAKTTPTPNLSATSTSSMKEPNALPASKAPSMNASPSLAQWLNSSSSSKFKKQGDIGSMLFGMKPKEKPKPPVEVQNNGGWKNGAKGSKSGWYGGGFNSNRKCPFYKKVSRTDIAVDAFSYGIVEGIRFYFLSHFHSDHYMGLSKKTWKQKIYCGKVTGNLVVQKLGLAEELIIRLPMWKEIAVGDVRVTLLEANHCPGAVLFLFKLRHNRVILHTGDFRARTDMEQYTALQGVKVHTLYLDTTYLDPNYRFPLQSDVINTAVAIATDEVKECPKTLFVVGTYLIGKERIFQAIAKAIISQVFVAADKFRTIQCLEDKELSDMVTKKPDGARVHVVTMRALNVKDLRLRLAKYPEFERIVAVKPTGWTHDSGHPNLNQIKPVKSGPVRIYGLPYSEHSSFEDLRRFVKFLRPSKIIPTVNVGRKETRDMMSSYLDKWKDGLDP